MSYAAPLHRGVAFRARAAEVATVVGNVSSEHAFFASKIALPNLESAKSRNYGPSWYVIDEISLRSPLKDQLDKKLRFKDAGGFISRSN